MLYYSDRIKSETKIRGTEQKREVAASDGNGLQDSREHGYTFY